MEFDAPKIIITSNINPTLWYGWAQQVHRDALLRRIDKIKLYDVMYNYDEKILKYGATPEGDPKDEIIPLLQ